MTTILDVKKLTMDFGGVRALNHLDLNIRQGEIAALIGPNGAGKTTFFNCITGIYTPTSGDIRVSPPTGKPLRINGFKPHEVTRIGMSRTFQNIRLFPNMTVLENIMIGRHCRTRSGIFGALLRPQSTRAEEKQIVDDSYQLLTMIGLENQVQEFARNLSYGDQRRLEIARAMATEPFLLLLDEPAAGLNPQETRDLVQLIHRIREEKQVAILLIEHDMKLVMTLSERIFVMDYGRKIAQGRPEDIRCDPLVIRAYLGEDHYA